MAFYNHLLGTMNIAPAYNLTQSMAFSDCPIQFIFGGIFGSEFSALKLHASFVSRVFLVQPSAADVEQLTTNRTEPFVFKAS